MCIDTIYFFAVALSCWMGVRMILVGRWIVGFICSAYGDTAMGCSVNTCSCGAGAGAVCATI